MIELIYVQFEHTSWLASRVCGNFEHFFYFILNLLSINEYSGSIAGYLDVQFVIYIGTIQHRTSMDDLGNVYVFKSFKLFTPKVCTV